MVQIAKLSMIEQLKDIWATCFSDSEEYIDLFFKTYFSPEHCLVWMEDEKPVAMLHMLSCCYVHEERQIDGHYLFALATLPAFRRRGIMAHLIDAALDRAKQLGHKFSVLVPAEKRLVAYYQQFGFAYPTRLTVTRLNRSELCGLSKPIDGCEQTTLTADELCAVRRRYFCEKGYIEWPLAYIDFYLRQLAHDPGNAIVLRDEQGDIGYALCDEWEGRCRILELCGKKEICHKLYTLVLERYASTQFEVRTRGDKTALPFGYYKILSEEDNLFSDQVYFSLAMD